MDLKQNESKSHQDHETQSTRKSAVGLLILLIYAAILDFDTNPLHPRATNYADYAAATHSFFLYLGCFSSVLALAFPRALGSILRSYCLIGIVLYPTLAAVLLFDGKWQVATGPSDFTAQITLGPLLSLTHWLARKSMLDGFRAMREKG